MDKNKKTIKYLNNLLETKQVSCRELTIKYLEAAHQENKTINAFVRITDDIALNTAKLVDEKIQKKEKLNFLEGIPMTIKDNISTKDIETTCCSKILEGYVPIYDATAWDILQKENAVLLGKSNMDEFGMGSSCETSIFGPTLNPHNQKHVAGGSSGGSAAAVAGNLAAYALGSDTGGSIRQPASFCGLVGLKPTYGAVSRYGLLAYASSFEQIGTLSNTVEDASLIFDTIAVYDHKDSTSKVSPSKTWGSLNNSVKGLKIGLIEEYFDGINEDVKKTIMNAVELYKNLGAEVEYYKFPDLKYASSAYYVLTSAEASSNFGKFDGIRYGYQTPSYNDLDEMILKTRTEGFGLEVKKRIMLGSFVLSVGNYDVYYKKALRLRNSIIKGFKEIFSKCDLVIAPAVPMTAFELNYTMDDPIQAYLADICTVPVNLAGVPAVSVPCGVDSNGLPIGMQIIGDIFKEPLILNVANQFEQNTSFKLKQTDMGVRLWNGN